MAEEFKVLIGAELKAGELDKIKNQINSTQTAPIKLTINTQNVQSQINTIKSQIQALSNIKINLGVGGSSGSGGVQKTANDVNNAYKDLVNLQRRISSIRIQLGGLDSAKDSGQVTELSSQLNRLMADYNNLHSTFSKKFSTDQIDNLNRAFETTNGKVSALNAKMSDISGVKQTESAYKELYNISKQISTLELKIGSLDTKSNSAEIAEMQNQLNNLRQAYQQVQTAFQGSLAPTQLSSLGAVIYDTQDKLNLLDAKIADTKAKLAGSIEMKLGTSEFTKDIANIELGMSKLSTVSTELSAELSNMRASLSSMKAAEQSGNMDAMISSYRDYETALKSANNQLKEATKNQNMYVDAQKLTSSKTTLSNQMDLWLQNNSAAAKQFGLQIQALKAELQSCDATRLNGIKSEFQQITQQAQLAGTASQSFGDKFNAKISKFLSATTLLTQAVRALRSMYDNVVQVDTAMSGLYRVTNLSSDEYSAMYSQMTQSAKDYGSTLVDIINSTSDWAKLGFDPSTAQELAGITTMYQHVTDLDTGTAVNNLVTAYKGFQDQLLELYNGDSAAAVEYVADIFNKLGNEYAVSAEDVGNALTKCASAMQIAGNSIQETSAMATGITEVIQNSEKAGSALKILSMRLRGTESKELEALGEDTEGLISNTSKLRDTIQKLSGVDIMIDDSTFKSTYEQMDAIAGVFHELSDINQAALLETIAGKNRASEVAALINNWKQVKSAVEAANGAEGSAAAENEIFMDSLQGKLNSLTTAWQTLSNTFLKSDFLSGLIEGLTGVVELLDTLVSTFGTLPTLATAFSAVLSAKGIGFFKVMDGEMTLFGSGIKSADENIAKLVTSISRYNSLSSKSASFQASYNSALANSNSSLAKYLIGLNGAKASLVGYKVSLIGAKVASVALQAATMALNMALTMGISLAISGLISSISKWINAEKEARQAAIETGNAAKESSQNIIQLYYAYKQANDAYNSNSGSKESLESATDSLLSALGIEEAQLQRLKQEYGDLDEVINQVTDDALDIKITEMTAAYHAQAKELLDDTNGLFSNFAELKWEEDTEEFAYKIAKIIEDAGFNRDYGYSKWWGVSLGDTSNIEGLIEIYQKLIDMRNALEDAVKIGDITRSEQVNSGLYSEINSKIKAIEDIDLLLDDLDEINKLAAERQYNDIVNTDGIPETIEQYEALRQSMLDTALQSGNFLGSQQQIEDSIVNTLSSFPELSQFFDDYADSISAMVEATEEQLTEFKNKLTDNNVASWFDSLSDDDKQLVYNISTKFDNTTLWTITKWEEELKSMQVCSMSTEESLQSFYDTMNDTGDDNFSEKVEGYLDFIETLRDALSKLDTGELTETDKVSLVLNFPELAGHTSDVDSLRNAISNLINTSNEGINGVIDKQIEELGGAGTVAASALESLRDMLNAIGTTSGWNFDIDSEIDKFNKLYDARKESVSGKGLSTEGIKNVEAMFSGLEGYNPAVLFERTENGIHLNTTALRALQAQYESTTKSGIQERLENLKQEYNDTRFELDKLTEGTVEYNQKMSELSGIEDNIQNVLNLATQYEGLTSAYNKWIMAKSAGEEGDMYDNFTGSLEDIKKLYDDGLVGTNAFRTAVQLMSTEDLSTANIDQIVAAYEKGYPKMQKYFTDSQDGCVNFLNDIQGLNAEWAHLNEDNNWEIDFGLGNDQAIADKLGINVEAVQILMRKLSDYGFDINLDSAYTSFDKLESKIEKSEAKLKELGQEPVDIDINAEDFNSEIDNAKTLIDELKNSDASVEVTAKLEDANNRLDVLISKKIEASQPSFMSIDASSVEASVYDALVLLQEYQEAVNNLTYLQLKGADASEIATAQSLVDELAGSIQGLDKEKKIKVSLEEDGSIESIKAQISNDEVKIINVGADTTQATTEIANIEGNQVTVDVVTSGNNAIDDLKSAIDGIQDKTVTITAKTVGKEKIDTLKDSTNSLINKTVSATANAVGKKNIDALKDSIDSLNNKTVTSTAKVIGTNLVNALKAAIDALYDKTVSVGADVFGKSAVNSLKYAIDSLQNKTVTTTTIAKKVGGVKGTTYAQGTAFAKGDWGTREGGVALGGELGQELVVRNGKFFTIGDNSAEFFKYQKGDIIFNADQTKEIFEKGKITQGNNRGKALAEGTAFSNGSGHFNPSGSGSTSKSSSKSKGKSKENKNKESKSTSSSEKDFREHFDWIEVAIDRLERAISKLDLKASSVYKSWSTRNRKLKDEISKVRDEVNLQQNAYHRYIKQANSVGLSSAWKKKVHNGEINISTITDEGLADKIQEYQEWYEKALDCKDAIDELKETEAELYKTSFDNVAEKYSEMLSVIEHEKNMLEVYINQSEEKGYITSVKYYEALMKNERSNIQKLEKEKTDLLNSLQTAIASGTIEKGSEAWYEMINQIDGVTLAIEEGKTALLEYGNSIRDIEWQIFDLLQERISYITSEADFLINLLSSDKLYDNRGQLTDEGLSTMGLHGVNYNVYMAQADKYAQEMLKINKKLATDPYNQDLAERKQELIELQQEMILAAQNEKEAIRDMVKEGIELELDALRDLIDAYTDALDAQKDLYDYQNKIAKQTKNIASLEKQMSAYQGDNSEEAKTKIQQLKVSLEEAKSDLEETEYEKYIADQKQLLDNLYNEYETIFNQRLDNLESLITDMIGEINNGANIISATVSDKANAVGYTLSESMTSIWDSNTSKTNDILTTYGQNITNSISSAATTVNNTLNTINANLQSMITQLNTIANTKEKSKSAATPSASNSSQAAKPKPSAPSKSSTSTATKTPKNKPKTGTGSGSPEVGDYVSFNSGLYYQDSYGSGKHGSHQRGGKVYITNISNRNPYPIHISKGKKLGSGDLGWLKLNQISGYYRGKENFVEDEAAWTQEGGNKEFIVRPSDGAILTPVAKGDSILNPNASSNIWDMANNPTDFIRENLLMDSAGIPHNTSGLNKYNQNLENVVFNLPNVKNYNELLMEMKKDKNFEKLIHAMTIDRLVGKSSLAKYNAIRKN